MGGPDGNMLKGAPFEDPAYLPSRLPSAYNPMHTFDLPKGAERHYRQQFADMYFLRLAQLKEAVRQRAQDAWSDFKLGSEQARHVDRVLDVRQGELCWVIGTVYMEMGLKPNVLDDISKEHWIAAPPFRETYKSAQDEMMLEDESGRLRLTGAILNTANDDESYSYVTGCVLAALGTEQADGTFQVLATQWADLPQQPQRWERDDSALARAKKPVPQRKTPTEKKTRDEAGKLAIVSGLDITGTADDDVSLELLVDFLTCESGGPPDQTARTKISRLLIAGNSLSHSSPILSREDFAAARKPGKQRHYGYDSSTYNASPGERFDELLAQILPAIPVTLIPGPSDPANVALPQQPLHPALFPRSRYYAQPPASASGGETREGLDSVTNPWEGDVEGWRVVGSGGQNVQDLIKYVQMGSVAAVDAMELMLRWRCIAPTAPDTLWCYPFQDDDPLIVKDCPHIYIVGNQAEFAKRVITGPAGQQVLLIAVPRFSQTREVVVLDLETLEVEKVAFDVRA